jgi:hypothetical protein
MRARNSSPRLRGSSAGAHAQLAGLRPADLTRGEGDAVVEDAAWLSLFYVSLSKATRRIQLFHPWVTDVHLSKLMKNYREYGALHRLAA